MSEGMSVREAVLLVVGFFIIAAIVVKQWERRLKEQSRRVGKKQK